jgi:hypothetical protein
MILSVIKYYYSRLCKIVRRLSCVAAIFAEGLFYKSFSGKMELECFSSENSLHVFSTKKDDLGLYALKLRFNAWIKNRLAVRIYVNRFNFCYLSEAVNFNLELLKITPLIYIVDFLDKNRRDFSDAYFLLVNELNAHLKNHGIEIKFKEEDLPAIKNMFFSIDAWSKKSGKNNEEIFALFEKIKRLPCTSLVTVIRYISLLVEETIVGPWMVVLDLYHKCNVDCLHCWIHSPKAKSNLTKEFLE